MSGKGSSPRPFSVSIEEFQSNFERIFGNKDKKEISVTDSDNSDVDVVEELRDRDITPGL